MEGENLKLIFPQLYYNNVARSDSAVGHLCGDFWRLLYNFRSWPFCWGRKGRCWVPQVFFQGATFHHSHHVRWVSGRIFDVETIFAPFSRARFPFVPVLFDGEIGSHGSRAGCSERLSLSRNYAGGETQDWELRAPWVRTVGSGGPEWVLRK